MKFHYHFSNLLGTVYRRGNLIFTPDGATIISPVGNKGRNSPNSSQDFIRIL
jgi:periodic tryptophan protein 2